MAKKPGAVPFERPLYTFDHDPTVDEMRAMAVKAMRDELSVPWFLTESVEYHKTGSVSHKTYSFRQGTPYAGLPYSNAQKGLFQWLEYYDAATGELTCHDSETFNQTVGNTCAGSLCWGLFSVCTSIRGRCISNLTTYAAGFYPLGEVSYPEEITDFNAYTTTQILRAAGEEKVMEGYALVQPADTLVFSEGGKEGGHVMMAIEKAQVVRRADGTIDPNESFITVQDQRAGFYQVEDVDGTERLYSGRIRHCAAFAELLKESYIAVTTAEFLGRKPYARAKVTAEGFDGTASSLPVTILRSNYPIAVAKWILTRPDGTEEVLAKKLTDRNDVGSGLARAFSLAGFAALSDGAPAGSGLRAEITVSTGEVFVPVRLSVPDAE